MPKKLEHSKGQWEWIYCYQPEFDTDDFHIFLGTSKRYFEHPNQYPEAEADAALMAGASRLLKAARTLLAGAKKYPELAARCEEMQKAIQKATERKEGAEEPVTVDWGQW